MIKIFVRHIITFLYSIYLNKKKIRIASNIYLNKKTYLKGNNIINSHSNIINSSIGFGTYLGEKCLLPNTIIGSYCSIANNVEILPYTHPTSMHVSTHPAFFSTLKQSGFTYVNKKYFDEELFFDKENGIHCKIGNDVWIGADVKILGGIQIGDGAIIAAGAIVTKTIPPFAIVGGIPAKIIRYRFNEDQIAFLLRIQWWNRDPQWLKDNSKFFVDIEKLILQINKDNQ